LIIAITANDFYKDREMAFEAWMNGYRPTPIKVAELMNVIVNPVE